MTEREDADRAHGEEEHIPPVHIVREGEKWGVCLSRLGKWVTGIAAGFIVAGGVAMVSLEINNAIQLGRQSGDLDALSYRVARVEDAIVRIARERVTDREGEDMKHRIERLESVE